MSLGRYSSRTAIAGLIWLVACQPLPHPFADDVPPPGSPLLTVPDSISLSIAPVAGAPKATAIRLAGAVARALRKHQIAASDKTASTDSDRLFGKIAEERGADGAAAVTAVWRLRNAAGRSLGICAARVVAPAQDWRGADGKAVARLAAFSADKLAILFLGVKSFAAPLAATRETLPTLAIGPIKGAPGDGASALAKAIAFILSSRHLANLASGQGKARLVLDADVAVANPKGGKEHVAIVWRLRRADGSQIGTVAQHNDVPSGALDHAWGNLAYLIADAAESGIMELLAHDEAAGGKS